MLQFLDQQGVKDVTLVITGGLRVAEDFAKAMMLGADAVAISNSALQAIGCLGMRACNTNNCPVGIATQKENLRSRLQIEASARQLFNFLTATTDLMKVESKDYQTKFVCKRAARTDTGKYTIKASNENAV